MKKDINVLNSFFKLNEKIELTKDEEVYLENLSTELLEVISEEGEVGEIKIREIVLDELLKNDLTNIISYLNLDLDLKIKENLENKLKDPNFLKTEMVEESNDFFMSYLRDDIVNDIIEVLKGKERRAEGSKETFFKKRGVKIPTDKIDAINSILISKFSKTEFMSNKDDNEQAMMIKFILEEILEILLEIPNHLCNTEETVEIMTICSVKLMNAVGLLSGLRGELMDTIKESMKSNRNQSLGQQQQQVSQ